MRIGCLIQDNLRSVGTDNKKNLIIGIFIVSLLILACMSVDYASEVSKKKQLKKTVKKTVKETKNVKKNKKIRKPTIKLRGRPSCTVCYRKHRPYKWRTVKFIDYCPHCHRYNVLYNAHKRAARHEKELTCKRCGADYCVCGKEKYSWSRYYLKRA